MRIDASGNVSCWGFNAYGELGNGVTVNPAGGVTPTGHPVTADLPGGPSPGRLPQEAPLRVPCVGERLPSTAGARTT